MNTREARNRPAMKLRIIGLKEGGHPFEFTVPAREIGLEEGFDGDVSVTGTLEIVASQYYVSGTIVVTLTTECDRCLNETDLELDEPISLYFQVSTEVGEEPDDAGDDVVIRTIHPDQDAIVLDEEVRQAVLLAVPLKILCREDCPGIRTERDDESGESGGDNDIDPRWASLADLFGKSDPDPDDE